MGLDYRRVRPAVTVSLVPQAGLHAVFREGAPELYRDVLRGEIVRVGDTLPHETATSGGFDERIWLLVPTSVILTDPEGAVRITRDTQVDLGSWR